MWTNTSMSVTESLLLSVMGLGVVMATLLMLAIVIIIFARIMEGKKADAPKQASTVAAEPAGISEESCVMIFSVICEELHAAPEELNITGIREIS